LVLNMIGACTYINFSNRPIILGVTNFQHHKRHMFFILYAMMPNQTMRVGLKNNRMSGVILSMTLHSCLCFDLCLYQAVSTVFCTKLEVLNRSRNCSPGYWCTVWVQDTVVHSHELPITSMLIIRTRLNMESL
jgi:hypothetical protein